MIVIYKKSNLSCVGVVLSGMDIIDELEVNVIPNFGGNKDDYSSIETNETDFHLELINDKITIVKNIHPIPEHEPSVEDYLLDYEFRISNLELGV